MNVYIQRHYWLLSIIPECHHCLCGRWDPFTCSLHTPHIWRWRTKCHNIKTLLGDAWLSMAVLAVIVRECQSSWTSVTPGGDREASLEFRAEMSNGSNLTSHTPSPFYQHLCWSAATVRCINLLSWPLQRLRCMLKGSCAAKWNCCVLHL